MFKENTFFYESRKAVEGFNRVGAYELNQANKVFPVAKGVIEALDTLRFMLTVEDRDQRIAATTFYLEQVTTLRSLPLDPKTSRADSPGFISQLSKDRAMLVKIADTVAQARKSRSSISESFPTDPLEVEWLAIEYRSLIYPELRAEMRKRVTRILSSTNLRR